ncbi:MAG TPA: baseplate J/gp47 family protein [Acidimicrobiales bacterium]|nr:baseplate J/gp47 family protein [Acidimicrobiales bacterium]
MTPVEPASIDRLQLLLDSTTLNGIDFVAVDQDQTTLHVHFLNTVAVTLAATAPVTISGGEVITSVAVPPIDTSTAWSADAGGRPVLTLAVAAPGDFSTYQLSITSDELDLFFSTVAFSFKAGCPSLLDCATPPPSCPETAPETVPIDYLAKDFGSFCQALSELSTLRYPLWVERSEADLGMVLMEVLAAIADELSYYQDRVAAESSLATATQRLSVLRHARLVDYEPAPATMASTALQLDVTAAAMLQAPLLCRASAADGSSVSFEVGPPLLVPGSGAASPPASYAVDPRWNRGALAAYYWDDSTRCLRIGSTVLDLAGQSLGLVTGQQLLLDTPAPGAADPPLRELVTIAAITDVSDELRNVALTRLTLSSPTTLDHDLYLTVVAGNIVPALQGERFSEGFTIPGGSPAPGSPPSDLVVTRRGSASVPCAPLPDYRYSLSRAPLAWAAATAASSTGAAPATAAAGASATTALPELVLSEPASGTGWGFEVSLLDDAVPPPSTVFTLTPEQYSPVLSSNGRTWLDYDGDGGTTIRFGDGTFGAIPDPGTSFALLYRVGGGSAGNVPADTVTQVVPGQAQSALVAACTNPFAATGGTDAETITQVRDRAPQAFRQPLRVVRPEDYVAAAQSLPFVQQAGCSFRWTGSWLTVLTTADPRGAEQPSVAELECLTELLDSRRLAGYESYVLPPRYVSLDLWVTVCGLPTAFSGDVEATVLAALEPGTQASGQPGFFDHSRWAFGQALEPSALLAAVQACTGVAGVFSVQYRWRGVLAEPAELSDTLAVAPDAILRVDNDPSRPEAGSLSVTVAGSK